jgi:hypothetical protein
MSARAVFKKMLNIQAATLVGVFMPMNKILAEIHKKRRKMYDRHKFKYLKHHVNCSKKKTYFL